MVERVYVKEEEKAHPLTGTVSAAFFLFLHFIDYVKHYLDHTLSFLFGFGHNISSPYWLAVVLSFVLVFAVVWAVIASLIFIFKSVWAFMERQAKAYDDEQNGIIPVESQTQPQIEQKPAMPAPVFVSALESLPESVLLKMTEEEKYLFTKQEFIRTHS